MHKSIPPEARIARLAVLSIFFLNGFGLANWVVRIPAVQGGLGIGDGPLGLALLGMAVGSISSMPLVGGIVSRFGSRPVVLLMSIFYALALALPTFAPNVLGLFLALVVLGFGNGSLDVSMNAQAVAVEKRYGRAIMSSFHGFFSLGGLAGSVIGGLIASSGVGPRTHLVVVALAVAVAVVLACRGLLPASADASGDTSAPAFARPTRALLGLGVIAFCVLLGEGAIGDWSAVYLRGTIDTGAGLAAAGFALFSLTMTAGRFAGDWLTLKLGPKRLVRLGGAIAAVGLGIGLAAGEQYLALVGFACAGIGFATVFPNALSAAGHSPSLPPGPALAAVATAGYFGFLVGPPTIGFISELTNLGAGLYLIVALSVLVVILAGAVETKESKDEQG